MAEIKIIVSGPVGCGKSAILGEIEILMRALGVPVRYEDVDAAQSEKNMTHADWTESLEMYKPSVVLVEDMPWLRADHLPALFKEGPTLAMFKAAEAAGVSFVTQQKCWNSWYGEAAQQVQADAKTAKQRYDAAMKPGEEPSAIERLRFFCSLAMGGQDWIDAEPFFAAVAAQQVQADAGAVSWRRVAYPDDVCVTKVERDAWLEEGWEVEALYTHPSPAGESDKRERFERFERIKRLALDAGGQGALPVPASLSKIVRECLDGIAAMSRENSEGGEHE